MKHPESQPNHSSVVKVEQSAEMENVQRVEIRRNAAAESPVVSVEQSEELPENVWQIRIKRPQKTSGK